jgi:hypothetical protein
MAKKFWVKTGVGQIFDDVRNFYVKTSIAGWAQVTDAWVKISTSTWVKFWDALMAPTNRVELIESYTGTNSETLRLQGRNYRWVPDPQTLKYYFRWIPDLGSTYYIGSGGSSGDTTTNPTTSIVLPGASSYITISPTGSNFELGKTNRYYFEVRATGASGSIYSSISQEDVKIVSPKAPTLSFTVLSSTSVNIEITAASLDDYYATYRYILYTYDYTGGFIYSGGGRGGGNASTLTVTRTLTGLAPGRSYIVYVLPTTGTTGTTPSNYSGYPGIEASLSNVKTMDADPQPFNTVSFIKNFPSSSSQGVVRSTSLSWNASTNASRYEIEYEGSYDNYNWTSLQSFAGSPYTSSTSQSISWGSPTPVGGFAYYTYMRARVRASNPDSSITVIGDNGAYIYATGSAPGQPTFGTITTSGSNASIPVIAGYTGSNYRYEVMEYQYRNQFGSYPGSWSTQSLNSGSGTISLSGLSQGTYYIKIRNRNYDDIYSSENETSFAISPSLTAPSVYYVQPGPAGGPVTAYFSGGSGPYYQIYWTIIGPNLPIQSYTPDGSGSSNQITDNTGPTSTATHYMYVRSVSSLSETSVGPSQYASEWSSGYSFNMTAPTYTITWAYNDGTGSSTSSTFTSGGSVPAPTITRNSYTLNGWYDTPLNDYLYFVSAGNLFYPPARNITMYARWTYSPPNLTPPSIYYVASGTAGGPVTAYFSGGSGPYYQIWWTTGVGGNSYDEYGYGNPITDNTGPTAANTQYYMYVRSVSALTNVGMGPSTTISEWSAGYPFTVSAPVVAAPTNLNINLSFSSGPSWTGSWSASGATSYSWAFYTASNSSGSNMTFRNGGTGTSMSYSGGTQVWGKLYVTATNSGGSVSGESAWV